METVIEFLENILTWENILQVATIVVFYFGADNKMVEAINWIKDKLNVSGKLADATAVTVVVLVTIATMIVQGQLAPDTVSGEYFAALFVSILYASHRRYEKLKLEKVEEDVEELEEDVEEVVDNV